MTSGTSHMNLTKGEFIDKYKTKGPLREAQLEVGQATYQKLKDMLFTYRSIRNKVVEKIHDPSSIIYKAVKEDEKLKMTHHSLDSKGEWRAAEKWLTLAMLAEQEDTLKDMVRNRVPVPDSPTKRSRTSPREVATSSVHLKTPASVSIQAGGLKLTPAPGQMTPSSSSTTSSEDRPKRKREQQALARAWDGHPVLLRSPQQPPPPPPPPPPASTQLDRITYGLGPSTNSGTISIRLESGDTLRVRIKEDGTYEQVPQTMLTESPWPATEAGEVHLPLKPW